MSLKAERPTGSSRAAPSRAGDMPAGAARRSAESSSRAAARRPMLLTGIRRLDLLAIALFVVCALLMFRLSLFEGWTFVGDSDRLNTALNIRLFETDAIRARGSVPTWSDD